MKLIRPLAITDAVLTSSNVAEDDYAAWDSGDTYAVGDRVIVVDTDVHKVFESAQASNLNHDPQTDLDSDWWLEVGATNPWRMFDDVVESLTTNASTIEVVLQTTGLVNAIALDGLLAETVRVVVNDATDGDIYDETYDLAADAGITDWYAYFSEPIVRQTFLTVTDLPSLYADTEITITIAGTGTVECALCKVGQLRELGGTQWGMQVGIDDYSIKSKDAFGQTTIVQRSFNKTATFALWVLPGMVDELHRLLAEYRATPVVWIGDERYGASVIFGFFSEFNIDIAYERMSAASLTVKGIA